MKKRSLKQRFKYWFDNLMSKGTGVMLLVLAIVVLVLVLIISGCICLGGWDDEAGFAYTLWDVLSTTINAWMPASEDGEAQYVALVALSALFGVLFTSFLIGIISSAVEDKLSQLREGNSTVIENGHLVVLGFKSGEYTLLQQLIMSQGDRRSVIVVADSCEKQTMEDLISENLDVPKNIRIICRNTDITNPASLECCSLETAASIIVNPAEDTRTLKVMLAVNKFFENCGADRPGIVTAVNQGEYIIPKAIREKYGFTMIHTNDAVARVIAHSCTQLGLSEAFSEVFSFEGNELHFEPVEIKPGMLFKNIYYNAEKAVPVGIFRDGETILNPDRDLEMREGDVLIVLEEEEGDFRISEVDYIDAGDDSREGHYVAVDRQDEKVVIIGANEKLGALINELPAYVTNVVLAGVRNLEQKKAMCKSIRADINYSLVDENLMDQTVLERVVEDADHVILLSDYSVDEEASDARNVSLLFKLRDIKERSERDFSITSEMCRDDNRNLIQTEDFTEFIVSSNMSAMVLAQIAINPKLYETFRELLSNTGTEFLLKSATVLPGCIGVEHTVAEIRRELIHKGCILVGYVQDNEGQPSTTLNPEISERIVLAPKDKFIVIC